MWQFDTPAGCAISLLLLTIGSANSGVFPAQRYPLPISINHIVNSTLACDSTTINATITLQHPFKGLLFAKDFSHECNTIGTHSNTLTLSLPVSGCGIRLSSRPSATHTTEMYYTLTLIAQQDRFLRQIADQERRFDCVLAEDALLVKTKALRAGKSLGRAPPASRAWMEVAAEAGAAHRLRVGQAARLSVRATLPAAVDWRVVDCRAQDGLGDASQRLLDENGCAVDDGLVPAPQMGAPEALEGEMRRQEAVTHFAAFKFPDRDRLHFVCRLLLCRDACPNVDCINRTRNGRSLDDQYLDQIEVYNSVEVLAPSFDDFEQNRDSFSFKYQHLPTDRSFCVSSSKIAITFCILGLIFLCAVLVSACALFKSRREGQPTGPYFYTATRSLFSSTTSSGGSGFGSKLLLQDSPCMGLPAQSRAPYGRIL